MVVLVGDGVADARRDVSATQVFEFVYVRRRCSCTPSTAFGPYIRVCPAVTSQKTSMFKGMAEHRLDPRMGIGVVSRLFRLDTVQLQL